MTAKEIVIDWELGGHRFKSNTSLFCVSLEEESVLTSFMMVLGSVNRCSAGFFIVSIQFSLAVCFIKLLFRQRTLKNLTE